MRRSALLTILLALAAGHAQFGPGGGGLVAPARNPGCERNGTLTAFGDQGRPLGDCPLQHTDVAATVSGFVSRVQVTQRFANPYTERIEAIYTFPLPHDSAVYDLEMKVGTRVIKGVIQPKQQARETYETAKAAGHAAALLEQERPNIFTQNVANIRPGETLAVTLRYTELMPLQDGVYRFVFPMVVGPRYMPGTPTGKSGSGWSPDTSRVPDASRISPPVTPPGTRAGHDISVKVTLDPGLPLRSLECLSHAVDTERQPWGAVVRLRGQTTIPNKDFILAYSVATDQIQDTVLTCPGADGQSGYFALVMQPPARVRPSQVVPKELVFVVDTSGSMDGEPIEKSKETVRHCLAQLNPRDTFNLITFAGDTRVLFSHPVPASAANLARARRVLDGHGGDGGTEMMKAIHAAFDDSDRQDHVRVVAFFTDAYVGNDLEIIGEVQQHPRAQVFSFGIGSSVNRFLIDGLARAGHGEAEYVPLDAPKYAQEAANRFAERLRYPVLTDIQADFGKLPVFDVCPPDLPDLFSAKPVVLTGRYSRPAEGDVTLRGRAAGGPWTHTVHVKFDGTASGHEVLPQLWARAAIEDLMTRDWAGLQQGQPAKEVEEGITTLGVVYRLMTQFTSFVAVEQRPDDTPGAPRPVVVPVELPAGVSYAKLGAAVVAWRAAPKPVASPGTPPGQGTFALPEGIQALVGYDLLSALVVAGPPANGALVRAGDPLISVAGADDARRVTAVLPDGTLKPLRWNAAARAWQARFDVPTHAADGRYTIAVVLVLANGERRLLSVGFTVSTHPLDGRAEVRRFGDTLALTLDAGPTARRVAALLPWGEKVQLTCADPNTGRFVATVAVPADRRSQAASVTYVLTDAAHNRTTVTVELAP